MFLTPLEELNAKIRELEQQVKTLTDANAKQGITIGRLMKRLEESNEQYFKQVESESRADARSTQYEYAYLQMRAQSAAWKASAKLWRRGAVVFEADWTTTSANEKDAREIADTMARLAGVSPDGSVPPVDTVLDMLNKYGLRENEHG